MSWRSLKHFCDGPPKYGLNIPAAEYTDGGTRFLRTTDINVDGTITPSDEAVYVDPAAVLEERHRLRDGDILLSRSGTLGRCLRYQDHLGTASFAGYLVRFRPRRDVEPRYLQYCSQARFFQDAIVADAVTSTISNFNAEKYAGLQLPWKDLTAQRAIADYLDTETARIDALVTKKRRMIELLAERRTQVMSGALAQRGCALPSSLDHESIRHLSVPTGWRTPKLSSTLRQLTNGFVGPTRDILRDEGVRYIQGLHVKNSSIDFDRRPYFVDELWHRSRPRTSLRAGDVVIVQTGDIGKCAVIPTDFGEANCHALLIARSEASLVTGEYLAAYLQGDYGLHSLLRLATGALHPHLEFGIRDARVVLPPLEEQHEIVADVAAEQARIDHISDRLARQLDLVAEHRQSLITAAVTGELRVPGVAA